MKQTLTSLVVCMIAVCSLGGLSCSQKQKDSLVISRSVTKVVIYYVNWSIDAFAGLTCDDLLLRPNHVEILDSTKVSELISALRKARREDEIEINKLDVRACCVFEDSVGNAVTKVSFSYTSYMQIDDRIYKTDASLFQSVLSYLPKDYLKT